MPTGTSTSHYLHAVSTRFHIISLPNPEPSKADLEESLSENSNCLLLDLRFPIQCVCRQWSGASGASGSEIGDHVLRNLNFHPENLPNPSRACPLVGIHRRAHRAFCVASFSSRR